MPTSVNNTPSIPGTPHAQDPGEPIDQNDFHQVIGDAFFHIPDTIPHDLQAAVAAGVAENENALPGTPEIGIAPPPIDLYELFFQILQGGPASAA